MNRHSKLDAEIEAVCKGSDVAAIDALVLRVITEKKDIESQLSQAKADLLEDRADLVAKGMAPAHATVQAGIDAAANGVSGWRASAATAAKMHDVRIMRLKARLKDLRPLGNVRTLRVEIICGTPPEIVVRLQARLDAGAFLVTMTTVGEDMLLAVFRE